MSVASLERMTTGSVAQRLTLSRHTFKVDSYFSSFLYYRFSLILRFLLPFLVITICNGLIISHIMRMTLSHASTNSTPGGTKSSLKHAYAPPPIRTVPTAGGAPIVLSRSSSSREAKRLSSSGSANVTSAVTAVATTSLTAVPPAQMTHNPHHMAVYTLFAVCAVFIVTLLPNAMLSILLYSELHLRRGNSDMYCVLRALDDPFKIVRLVNYSANFVLYGLTGRRFRRELQLLFMNSKILRKLCPRYLKPGLRETILLRELRPTPDRTWKIPNKDAMI